MKRIAFAISLVICVCLASPALGDEKPLVVELWPGTGRECLLATFKRQVLN